jgi:Starch-binding associating with outer membrane
MKLLKIKNALFLAVLLAATVVSCKKDDFAINTSPSEVTASTVEYKSVLPASLAATATIQATNFTVLQKWMGYWARSGSYQSIGDEETYSFTNDFGQGLTPWNNLYTNANNYNFVAKTAKANGAGTYEAIARIMKALDFQMLVDIFGNIPYSEAFDGGNIRTPKYDDDKTIYANLFRELDAAIALLNNPTLSAPANNIGIATDDLVFKGDKTKWKKMANTIKLRMLMHMANTTFASAGGVGTETNTFIPGANQVAEMAIITAEGSGFLGVGESAKINPGYNDTKPNPYWRLYVTTETGSPSGTGDQTKANAYAVGPVPGVSTVGYYGWNTDPRINKFYTFPAGSTTHRGIPYGEIAGFNPNNTGNRLSFITPSGLLPNGASSDAWILTSTESLFLQAEAMRRGLIVANAGTMLTTAIRESFVSLGLTVAQADAYIVGNAGWIDVDYNANPTANPGNSPGGYSGGMYTIISQKWFALNCLATLEVWTDYRRTNMKYGVEVQFAEGPAISTNPSNTKTKIPIRMFYPQNEYSFNPTNVAAEGVVDVFTGGGITGRNRIFWDQN